MGEVFGEAVGFGGEVAGVYPDDGDVGEDAGDEAEHDGGLDAEAGGEDEAVAEGVGSPLNEVCGVCLVEFLVECF